jgi:predicted DNA-binding transcriptional regulator AlpA
VIEQHFSPRELAELYDIRETTLAQWRHRSKKEPGAPSRGPRFKKLGRLVRYAESDVRVWASQRELVATPSAK